MSDEKSKPIRGSGRQPPHENEGNLNPEDNGNSPQSSESSSSNPLSDPENVDHQKREADELAGPVAGCSGNNPQPSTSASGDNLPVEGAVGGQVLEEQSGAPLNPDEDLLSRCKRLDGRAYPGKVELLKRYLKNDEINIRPRTDDNPPRTRHNATRFQGSIPIPSQFSSENPSGNLQTPDPEQEPLLNQARAIADSWSRAHQRNGNDVASGNNGQLIGFGSGSAVTNPIGEVYTPPVTCSDTSSREMSSSSLPQSSSPVQLPGFQESFGAVAMAARRKMASDSTSDSGNRQKAEQPRYVRRKRSAVDRPDATIPSGESGFAGSEGSYSDHKKPRTDHDYSAPPQPPAPDSDKNENSPDEPASEDTESYSIGSEVTQQMPDLVQPPLVNEANPPGQLCDQEPIGESSNEEDMDVSASGCSKNGEKRQSDES